MNDFAARRLMMVDTQIRPSDVTSLPILEAMLATPREVYVPREMQEIAYAGGELAVVPSRPMLEPRSLAKLLEALRIQPGEIVLDVGCALGYSSAVIARLADTVVAIEEDEASANEAQRILSSQSVDNAAVIHAALAEGAAKHGPYDVIVIQGGVEEIPAPLCAQLKEGGRIGAIFMSGQTGAARIGYKKGQDITWRAAFDATAPVLAGFGAPRVFSL